MWLAAAGLPAHLVVWCPQCPGGPHLLGCPFSTCPRGNGRPPTLTRAPNPGSAFLWGQALLVQALPLVGGCALLTHGPEPGPPRLPLSAEMGATLPGVRRKVEGPFFTPRKPFFPPVCTALTGRGTPFWGAASLLSP